MKLTSKWSYMATGANIIVTLFGAALHSISLILIGFIFAIWNWYTAEKLRRIEYEQIRKSVTKTEN